MGDLNIGVSNERKDNNILSDLCDTFYLQNKIIEETCRKSCVGTSVEVMLTNRPRSFHKIGIFETGISKHHKLIISFLSSYFTRIAPKTIECGKYKTFEKNKFLHDLDQELLKRAIYQNNDEMYSIFTRIFQNVLNKHSPHAQINHAPFMTKDLSKAIMNKSKSRNKYLERPSRENFLAIRSAKSFCNNLIKTNKKSYLQKVTQKGFAKNQVFWR